MKKIGLVFSGGGGKGAYEIGVWRAMEELGLAKDIIAVSGTSVGALNAALFAQGDLNKAEEAWLSMSPSDILSIDITGILTKLIKIGVTPTNTITFIIETLSINGVFKRDGLSRIIDEYLNVEVIKLNNLPVFACATKVKTLEANYFQLQDFQTGCVKDILLASSAIPVAFPAQMVEDEMYLDGFLTDNTPIQPLTNIGCDIVITVMLDRSDLLPTDKFPDSKIIPIYPQECPGMSLNFSGVSEKMQHGYDDTMKVLAPVFELIEINYQYSKALLNYKDRHQKFNQLMLDSNNLDKQIDITKEDLLEVMNKW